MYMSSSAAAPISVETEHTSEAPDILLVLNAPSLNLSDFEELRLQLLPPKISLRANAVHLFMVSANPNKTVIPGCIHIKIGTKTALHNCGKFAEPFLFSVAGPSGTEKIS